MSLQEAYDALLEDTECTVCRWVGMLPDGGFNYECPNCGATGTVLEYDEGDAKDDDDEDDEDGGF